MRTLNTMDPGKLLPRRKLLHSPPHKTHFILTSSHSMLSLDQEELMTDPKLTDIMTEMVMRTPNTMDPGKHLPKRKQLHSLLHKTHSTPTSFHSMLSPDQEELMTDPKPTVTTMVMVTSTPNTMVHGKHSPKPPHLLLHKTQSTQMSFHSKPTPEQEELTIDPKLTVTTTETVMLTPNTMDNGKYEQFTLVIK